MSIVTTRRKFASLDKLQQYGRQHGNNNFGLRIVYAYPEEDPYLSTDLYRSLNQDNSWKPLNVTRDMLGAIMDLTCASPEFLDIISCFHTKSKPTEEGFCSAPFFRCSADGMGKRSLLSTCR